MSIDKIALGQLVKSHAGRDRDKLYVVVGLKPPLRALLADGRERKVARPKQKNIRHIIVLGSIDKGVAEKITCGKATDEDIRQAINTCGYTGE